MGDCCYDNCKTERVGVALVESRHGIDPARGDAQASTVVDHA